MAGIQKRRTTLLKEYLAKHTDMPSRTLARLVHTDHPSLWHSVDVARESIRYFRQTHGKKNAKSLKDDRFVGDGRIAHLPTEESEDYSPYVLPKELNNIGIISDIHIPNHRNRPVSLALDKFAYEGINTLLINGDLLDNTPFSKFDKSPPQYGEVKRWFDKCESFLEHLRDSFPKAKIVWLEGNHDFWYKRWLMKHAPMLYGDSYFSMEERLHLTDYKIEFLPQERYLMAGKLAVAHGHHIVKGIFAPVNAARGVYLKAKASTIIGHVHVTSEHTETNLHGDIVTTWSTGCMCTLTPDYQPMAGKANHGFACVKVGASGEFHVKNYRVYNGKVL